MSLSLAIRQRFGTFALSASFETSGRLIALFGPSGSGKTSLINLIGGLLRPDEGKIVADGRILVDTATGTFVPRHKRRIGYVFQDARLFPHMSVRQNLDYGRFFTPRAERRETMSGVVDMLGIGHLLERRPGKLSGGERQRVAIGRALLSSPRLILMDEPLASLDDQRKAEIMPYIERLRDDVKTPIVYVSHSLPEVARLATDIVVLDNGTVSACGPAAQILRQLDLLPSAQRSEGGTLIDMQVVRHDAAFALTILASAAGEIRVAGLDLAAGTNVRIRIRAHDVMVATELPRGLSALNVLNGTIVEIDTSEGPFADISIDCNGQQLGARITRQSAQMLGLLAGMPVYAVIKSVSFDRGHAAFPKTTAAENVV